MRRLFKRFRRRRISFLDKRQRFAIQTSILTAGLLVTQLIWEDVRFFMVGILSILSYTLTVWSLREDIKRGEWLYLFILPVLFTSSVSLFYFLLPNRLIIRLVVTVIFAVGTYAILLVENIYNVAAQRSIQLLRAARSVGLLLTLVAVFLSANIIYSFRLAGWFSMPLLSTVCFFLALQSLWSAKIESKISKSMLLYAGIVSLGIGELSLALSFWPIQNAAYSLLMTASFYAVVSIIQQYFLERLFHNTAREYILVMMFTLFLTLVVTRWGT